MEGGEGVWHQGGGQHWVAAGLGVTLAVLLPGRAGCPRALGERAMLGGKQKRGALPRGRWRQVGGRRHSRGAGGAWEQSGDRAAPVGAVRAEDGAAGPGSACHGGSARGSTAARPGALQTRILGGRGAGAGWQGPGLVAARDPRRALAGAPVSPAAWGPRRGPPGSCGKGEGKGPRCGGSGGRPRAGDSAGPGRGGVTGTWGGWPAGRSSGHCRWSRGEAGSWRGIWLSCWTCTAEDREAGGQQGAGLGGAWRARSASGGRTGRSGRADGPGAGASGRAGRPRAQTEPWRVPGSRGRSPAARAQDAMSTLGPGPVLGTWRQVRHSLSPHPPPQKPERGGPPHTSCLLPRGTLAKGPRGGYYAKARSGWAPGRVRGSPKGPSGRARATGGRRPTATLPHRPGREGP